MPAYIYNKISIWLTDENFVWLKVCASAQANKLLSEILRIWVNMSHTASASLDSNPQGVFNVQQGSILKQGAYTKNFDPEHVHSAGKLGAHM